MLEREIQERGMNSSAAGSGAPASVSENQLTANSLLPPTIIEISVASQLQEVVERAR